MEGISTMKIFLLAALVLLISASAFAQTAVAPCVPTQSAFGGTNCVPVTSTNLFPVTTSMGSAVTPIVSSALESGHVLKAAAGSLLGLTVTTSSAAGYMLLFNATSVPGDGAVTPTSCYSVPAGSTVGVYFGSAPLNLSTGISVAFSTTGCFTKTASATAFFSGEVQ
jgi:hypothetical protein